ncbi:DUF2515 domain-containing protein [Lentibacillus halophilus]|uniref:DUF2515 domain-containing protein n=1 Tax=Lentibacillus halophilus TaxID=295065 RepID=A0ABN0ZDR0_9BACI
MIYFSEKDLHHYIRMKTNKHNVDNISRTKAYQNIYMCYPKIKWAFLASIVSRNAGWNMTDLYLSSLRNILSEKQRCRFFMTYERANWLIFSDAYPQLLLYELSVLYNQPMFHLLPHMAVSRFMKKEWDHFWKYGDQNRLMIAMIINEQNVIHSPVIQQDYFQHRIFRRLPYLMQDKLWLNAVLLPTRTGNVFGAFVHDFTNIHKRIELGKRIASIMFHPHVYHLLFDFALSIDHTGSRRDYEQFLEKQLEGTPFLRTVYPVIAHQDNIRKDWYRFRGVKRKWFRNRIVEPDSSIKNAFYNRRKLLGAYGYFRGMATQNKSLS